MSAFMPVSSRRFLSPSAPAAAGSPRWTRLGASAASTRRWTRPGGGTASASVTAASPRRDGLGISATALIAIVMFALMAFGGVASTAHASGGSISGTVRDASGAPLANMEVRAVGKTQYSVSAFTSDTGTYTVPFSAGSWVIYVNDPMADYAGRAWPDAPLSSLGTPIALADGASVTGIDVQLPLAARVFGVVRDTAGNPVTHALIGAKLLDTLLGDSVVNEDGSFEWFGLSPGDWTFSAMGGVGSPLALKDVAVTLAPGQVAEFDIVLSPKFAPVSPPGAPRTPSLMPTAPQAGGVAPPLGDSAPIIVAPLKGRVAVSAAGTLTRAVRCLERSHCAAALTVTTADAVRVAKGKPKARVLVAQGVVDTSTIESTVTLKVTSVGKRLLRKAGSDGLVVKLLSNPTLAGAPASSFKMTLVGRR